ncbi:GbsR/MarR family transcriptional regulator [Pseudooceanicola aestuarii]|uniref:GbsR/MarR family transcriptional regulator n=1 Tax=Pseudooceanicola aestuarii TaxID=2697319 RepID=UPI0013D59281|nr:MarR family transcriptional regulator [Pseudooceanicola aestuarii]
MTFTPPDPPPTPAEDRFIETLGLISQQEGAPRIAGRIVGYLVLAGEARSLTRIAQALGVSKASVSTNLRQLETWGAAVREAHKGTRQDLWRAVETPQHSVLTAMAQRFDRHARTIDAIAAELTEAPQDGDGKGKAPAPSARQKVADHADFYRRSADFLRDWTECLTPEAPDRADPRAGQPSPSPKGDTRT